MWGDNECEPNVTDFVIRPVWYPTIQNTIPNTIPYQIPYQIPYSTIPYQILYHTKFPSPIRPRFHPTGSSIVQTLGKRFEGIRLPAGAWLLQRSLDLFGHGVITVDCPLIFGEVTIGGNYRVVSGWRGQISPQQVFAWHDITWEGTWFDCRASPDCG